MLTPFSTDGTHETALFGCRSDVQDLKRWSTTGTVVGATSFHIGRSGEPGQLDVEGEPVKRARCSVNPESIPAIGVANGGFR
jgi:hypothetical protein